MGQNGATDGLYLRNACIPVLQNLRRLRRMDDVRVHGQDDRIQIDHFPERQEFS